jgi:biopolymer transport protein ExbD
MEFRYRRRVDSNIDMTPMIDTLLQLFVVFLLSMSFMTSAVRLELPQAALDQLAPDTPVVVTVNSVDKLFINDEPISRAELQGRLHTVLGQAKNREVLLRADRTLLYDKILDTLIEMQKAGATNVHLAFAFGETGKN